MAPAKKGQQKMSLGDFLGDQTLGSWADEMEDMPVGSSAGGGGGGAGYGGERRGFNSGGGSGFSGDRASGFADRGYAVREQLPLPSKPPYTAHLGNLSFDATEGDVQDFFSGCDVAHVRIVEDKLERKPKGFGYVEFSTLDGLKKALELSGTPFQGRNVRVSVADPPKDRPEGSKDMSTVDWTRKGPLPDLPGQRRTSDRGGYRQFDAGNDAGSERGGDRRRPPPFSSDGKERDFGNWERKGPLSPAAAPTGPPREGGRVRSNDGPPRERRQSPAWGEGRSNDGSRPPRREFQERPHVERQPTAPELDNQWRSKMRPDAATKSPLATPDVSTPSSPAPQTAAPATRPKLNLQKRTVSEAEPAPLTASSEASSRANPFGAARPIDTAAREREIEEKKALALRQKKEADEKAREEKKAKETAEKAAAGEKTDEKSEEKATEEKQRSNFEILQRVGEEGEAVPNEDAPNAPANGNIVEDKAVKPKEVVRDSKIEGAWRRKSNTPAAPGATTTEKMDDDGWSTVTKPGKNTRGNRRGGPSRAIAS